MLDPASECLPFGALEVAEVYFYHDFPRFFSLESKWFPSVNIVATCIEEDDEEFTADFLYAVMNQEEFDLFRSGAVTLRAWIEASERRTWFVQWRFLDGGHIEACAEQRAASDFDEDDLPLRGAVLELPTATAEVFDRQRDVIDRSERSRRTIVALELEDQQLSRTEFRIKELGEFQIALQNFVTAVGQEMFGQPTVRGQVPKAIQDATRLVSTAERRAASYVFFVSPDADGTDALFEDPLASRAIEEVTELIGMCGNQDTRALQEQIMTRSPRVRGRLLGLLNSLDSARSSLGLIAKGPSLQEALETHLTWASVKVAQSLIEGAERMSAEVRVKRGVLLAYDTTSGSFKLTDLATTDEYRGKAADDLREALQAGVNVGQGSLVSAILKEEKVSGTHDAIEPRHYTMVDVEVIGG